MLLNFVNMCRDFSELLRCNATQLAAQLRLCHTSRAPVSLFSQDFLHHFNSLPVFISYVSHVSHPMFSIPEPQIESCRTPIILMRMTLRLA